jgi:hypothetical protein
MVLFLQTVAKNCEETTVTLRTYTLFTQLNKMSVMKIQPPAVPQHPHTDLVDVGTLHNDMGAKTIS